MEKAKKSKKKLIAIIAGAAMAFVLTVAVSVGATLAFFGQKATTGESKITLGQALEFNGAVAASVGGGTNVENALPGQNADLEVTGKVKASSTKGFLLAELTIGGTLADKTALPGVESATVVFGTDDEQTCAVSGKYVYVGTGGNCQELTFGSDTEFTITVKYTIPNTLTNDAQSTTLTLNATVSVIQSSYLGTDGGNSTAIADVIAALDKVSA